MGVSPCCNVLRQRARARGLIVAGNAIVETRAQCAFFSAALNGAVLR
jgi:hypothetical protein